VQSAVDDGEGEGADEERAVGWLVPRRHLPSDNAWHVSTLRYVTWPTANNLAVDENRKYQKLHSLFYNTSTVNVKIVEYKW